MTYPESSDVSAGQPTASAHYNNLRKDALYLGLTSAEATALGNFLASYVHNIKLEYLATNRIRAVYDSLDPARIMVNGHMLYQSAAIDSGIGIFSGAAAIWYIFAQQNAGSTAFSVTASTSPTPLATQRLIGECYWDGTNLVQGSIRSYFPGFPVADYDSGWFAVTTSTTYSKAHNFGTFPRMYKLFHSPNADGSVIQSEVGALLNGTVWRMPVAATTTTFEIKTASDATYGTLANMNGNSAAGCYRILAWK